LDVLGTTGLRELGGRLQEEFHPDLRGRRAVRIYREMLTNHPLIGAARWLVEVMARQVDWSMAPAELPEGASDADRAEAQRLADWFEGAMRDMEMPWSGFVSEVMGSMPWYGFSYHEVLFKIRTRPCADPYLNSRFSDRLWGWRDFAPRSQDSLYRWEIDKATKRLLGMWQQVDTDGSSYFVPMAKALLFRVRSVKGSPESDSLLRSVYRPYHLVVNNEEAESIGIYRKLAGYPTIRVPWQTMSAGATQAEQDLFALAKKMVQRMRADTLAGIVWPGSKDKNGQDTGFDVGFLQSDGRSVAEADPVIRRLNSTIMIAFLAQFLLLSQGAPNANTGSYSLAENSTDVLAMAIRTLLTVIVEGVSNVAIPQLARLNGFRRDILPKLAFGDIDQQDVTKLITTMAQAVQAGLLVVDDALERWIRDQAGWPAPSVGAPGEAAPRAGPQGLLDQLAGSLAAGGQDPAADPYASQ